MSSSYWCDQCKIHYINVRCDLHQKPIANLSDIAERDEEGKWTMVIWPLLQHPRFARWKRSTLGHYYSAANFHPWVVSQKTYVMDNFGDLQLVYEEG